MQSAAMTSLVGALPLINQPWLASQPSFRSLCWRSGDPSTFDGAKLAQKASRSCRRCASELRIVSCVAEDENSQPKFTPNNERYQRAKPLTKVQVNALRAESQRLGKRICVENVGKQGITPNLIASLGNALSTNELVKVFSLLLA
jgi:CRS1 / YhbY (CRM) domain